ncbi:hypothetical protein DYBT9275_06040 [Dyadobacter sp. CECT 9275]|uniref:Uncharacterized protein n=1 Tax=Dyadobacter helix TaxID=2822344 RepID=A0A916JJA2_9BACT|nr:hypothetical protein DYBT9275_06040 [Dyadobacter sp. CECT 9275]
MLQGIGAALVNQAGINNENVTGNVLEKRNLAY